MDPKTILLTRSHGLSHDSLYERGARLIEQLQKEYELELGCDPKTGDITFWCERGQARGVKGYLRLAQPIELSLTLPGFLAVMWRSIQQEIEEILAKEIG